MATTSAVLLQLLLLIAPFLISPAASSSRLKCTSQKFTGSANYPKCADLPTLNAFLHWNYDHTNSTLSVAYEAPPAKPDGWVAWALNPTGDGMAGAQALLAYKASNGSMVVKTYNISSYSSIVEGKISFDVLDKRAEFSNGVIRIFAKLALPAGTTTVNHIWQVGSAVNNGVPVKHDFGLDNLNAKGTLQFVQASPTAGSPAAAPASTPGGSPSANETASGPSSTPPSKTTPHSGSTRSIRFVLETYGLLLLLGVLVYGF